MAQISKFYLHDAVTPNVGTMPSGALWQGGVAAATGDAPGARTARLADDLIGAANPDTESTVTANADQLLQRWGHRRFVSPPLATTTLASGSNWTWSFARIESSLNHGQTVQLAIYVWRPSTGAQVGAQYNNFSTASPTAAATEQAISATHAFGGTTSVVDGDILVFDVTTAFTQTHSSAYTEQFCYDGTTEASTTTCASFVTPPTPLILAGIPDVGMALTVT